MDDFWIDGIHNTYLEEFSSILITVINSNGSAADTNVEAYSEIGWLKWHAGAILFDHKLSFEESTLWSSTVDHLGLSNHNWSVLEEVVHNQFSNSEIFKAGFDNALFEVAIKSQNLIN